MSKQCEFAECERKVHAKGYCNSHYQQTRRGTEVSTLEPRGLYPWYLDSSGYVVRKYVINGIQYNERQHRVVVEQQIGRKLYPWENVHHIDGNRANNDPSNLELWVVPQPSGQRLEDRLADAYRLLNTYIPDVLAY